MLSEKTIRIRLVKLFEEFLCSPEAKKQIIANKIDNYCSKLVKGKDIKHYSPEVQEIIWSSVDLHHWQDTEINPTLTINKIREIVNFLKRQKDSTNNRTQ